MIAWLLLALVGFVALVQALVWLGGPNASPGQRLLGMVLAPLALIVLVVALLSVRVPYFWS